MNRNLGNPCNGFLEKRNKKNCFSARSAQTRSAKRARSKSGNGFRAIVRLELSRAHSSLQVEM
jgi:hypothetical protein